MITYIDKYGIYLKC